MPNKASASILVRLTLLLHFILCDYSPSKTLNGFIENVDNYPSDAIRGALLEAFPNLAKTSSTQRQRGPMTNVPDFGTAVGSGGGAAAAGAAEEGGSGASGAAGGGDVKIATAMSTNIPSNPPSQKTEIISKVYGCVGIQKEIQSLDIPVCETTVEEIQPKFALASDGNYQYIVNDPQFYQQKIFTQTCKYKNKPCDFEADLRSGYSSECVQSYATVKMLAYINGTLREDNFQLPVSCDCYLKSFFLD